MFAEKLNPKVRFLFTGFKTKTFIRFPSSWSSWGFKRTSTSQCMDNSEYRDDLGRSCSEQTPDTCSFKGSTNNEVKKLSDCCACGGGIASCPLDNALKKSSSFTVQPFLAQGDAGRNNPGIVKYLSGRKAVCKHDPSIVVKADCQNVYGNTDGLSEVTWKTSAPSKSAVATAIRSCHEADESSVISVLETAAVASKHKNKHQVALPGTATSTGDVLIDTLHSVAAILKAVYRVPDDAEEVYPHLFAELAQKVEAGNVDATMEIMGGVSDAVDAATEIQDSINDAADDDDVEASLDEV
jgi:hypothetical protein